MEVLVLEEAEVAGEDEVVTTFKAATTDEADKIANML